MKLPTVEVRYKNLCVEAECEIVHGKPLPTLWNSVASFLSVSKLFCLQCPCVLYYLLKHVYKFYLFMSFGGHSRYDKIFYPYYTHPKFELETSHFHNNKSVYWATVNQWFKFYYCLEKKKTEVL